MNMFPSLSSPDQAILADFVEEIETNGSNIHRVELEKLKAPSPRSMSIADGTDYADQRAGLLYLDTSSEGSTPPDEKAAMLMPYLVPSYSKQPSNEAEVERIFKDVKENARI